MCFTDIAWGFRLKLVDTWLDRTIGLGQRLDDVPCIGKPANGSIAFLIEAFSDKALVRVEVTSALVTRIDRELMYSSMSLMR